MDHFAACHSAAQHLEEAAARPRPVTLVGLDGFIDEIISVVDTRRSQADFTAVDSIAALGQRISAAAGRSTNIELVVQRRKIGGNGPIMAAALLGYGHRLTYVGNVGDGAVDPVFAPLVAGAVAVHSLGPAAHTDALEFADGKVMLGKMTPLDGIDAARLIQALGGATATRALIAGCDGVATVNWTMILGMTAIWRHLATEVLPGLPRRPRWFIDLADPAKRTPEDLADALAALRELQAHADVILGMNGSEGRQVLRVLGGSWQGDDEDTGAAATCAAEIQRRLGISCAMVHLVGSAAAADASGVAAADGFRCRRPLITTGAGDHFNAGFFAAQLDGLGLTDSLLVGGATSGCYVRRGASPDRADVAAFLRRWTGAEA